MEAHSVSVQNNDFFVLSFFVFLINWYCVCLHDVNCFVLSLCFPFGTKSEKS